ncbi:MAG: hypothetical protein ACM3SQ_12980 [Betaproteobacteria bacterium]
MSDRRTSLGASIVLVVFGLGSFFSMSSRGSLAGIRSVDLVQLIGTGMCFGAAIYAFVSFARGPKSK